MENEQQQSQHKAGCSCGCMGIGPIVSQVLRGLGPSEEVSNHFNNARLEVLKGLRAMLDEQIAHATPTPKTGTKFNVE